MADAKAAGLDQKDNWKKYKRNMLFARALSNGQKWYAPDVFNGATVYTPDELGADVDGDGNVIESSFTHETTLPPPPPQADRPYSPEALIERIQVMEGAFIGKLCVADERTSVRLNLTTMAGGEEQYHNLLMYLTGFQHLNEVPDGTILALKKWIHVTKQDDGTWIPDDFAIKEAKAVMEMLKPGQGTLL